MSFLLSFDVRLSTYIPHLGIYIYISILFMVVVYEYLLCVWLW